MSARILTPFPYKDLGGKWPFVLQADSSADLGWGLTGTHTFVDRGNRIAKLDGDTLTIYRGYASDGASPYFGKVCGIRIGTPSHARTAPAWFCHDVLYQIAECPCCVSWDYNDADDVLYDLMREQGSRLGGLYHAGLAIFGGLHRHYKRKQSAVVCRSNHRMQ